MSSLLRNASATGPVDGGPADSSVFLRLRKKGRSSGRRHITSGSEPLLPFWTLTIGPGVLCQALPQPSSRPSADPWWTRAIAASQSREENQRPRLEASPDQLTLTSAGLFCWPPSADPEPAREARNKRGGWRCKSLSPTARADEQQLSQSFPLTAGPSGSCWSSRMSLLGRVDPKKQKETNSSGRNRSPRESVSPEALLLL